MDSPFSRAIVEEHLHINFLARPVGHDSDRVLSIKINAAALAADIQEALDAALYAAYDWDLQIIVGADVIEKHASAPITQDITHLRADMSFRFYPMMILGHAKGILVAPLPKGFKRA